MEWVQLPVAQFGAVGGFLSIVFIVFRLISTGGLVPRKTHEERIADRDARVAEKAAEAAEYKAAWLASEKARHEQDNHLGELMEYARTTDAIIRSLAAKEGPRDVVAP